MKPIDRQYVIFMLGVLFGAFGLWFFMWLQDTVPVMTYLLLPLTVYGVVVVYRVVRDAWRMTREYQREDRWNG